MQGECDHIEHETLVATVFKTRLIRIQPLFFAEGECLNVRFRSPQPFFFVLHATFEVANPREIFIQLSAIVGTKRFSQLACLLAQRIEDARATNEFFFALGKCIVGIRAK